MTNDPISDLLIRLQNASRVGKTQVGVSNSRIKSAVAKILEKEGYLAGVSKKNNTLTLSLSYKNGRASISGVKRISKLSRRTYLGVRDLHSVKRGHGVLVLSTSAGVMTGKEAKQKRVGGEALFEIW